MFSDQRNDLFSREHLLFFSHRRLTNRPFENTSSRGSGVFQRAGSRAGVGILPSRDVSGSPLARFKFVRADVAAARPEAR